MIAYPAMLDVPTELVTFVAELLAAERLARGTRAGTRALTCEKQAIFALVWFRERRDVAITGKGTVALTDRRSGRVVGCAVVLSHRYRGLPSPGSGFRQK